MTVCLNCGKETDGYLCDQCRGQVDLEELCGRIMAYRPGIGENAIWDGIAAGMEKPYAFRDVVLTIAEDLPSPRKEYWAAICYAGNGANVRKDSREWLYETYERIKTQEGLNREEVNRIKGMVLGALFMDYRYEDAEVLAGELLEEKELPTQGYYNLADFYSKTRRYDEADDAINGAKEVYGEELIDTVFKSIAEKNRKYREAEATGKKEYMPAPRENREEARKAYVDFLASIGIDAEMPDPSTPRRNIPQAIPKDQYPNPKEIRDANFDSFVAYDLETTGLSPNTDSIIEIGAIKVVNGEIVESGEFVFQEFVKPFKKSIREEVTELTGITKEDVRDARQMWEVFPDFMKFVGDNILVGYHSIKFDSRFLVRAGRYSSIVMENPQFDVVRYAISLREAVGLPEGRLSLKTVSEKLGIENPEAHRALADAITTAKVFLKLKELEPGHKKEDVDDILSDIDSW